LAVACCLVSFVFASFADPGVVHQDNVDEACEMYDYDAVVFVPDNLCSTCKTKKPARSKHCSLCDVCVMRFDHHCVWIGNCVGGGNIGYFLLFLVSNFILCLYGTVELPLILCGIVKTKSLWTAEFVDLVTKKTFKASTAVVWQYLLGYHGTLVFLSMLCGVFALLVGGFTVWHLYMALLQNMTTNESYKYSWERERQQRSANPLAVRNVYNRGITQNFYEVMCPKRWSTWSRQRKANEERLQQQQQRSTTAATASGIRQQQHKKTKQT